MLQTRAPGNAAPIAATVRAVRASPARTTVPARAFAPCTLSTSDNADGTALIRLPARTSRRYRPAPAGHGRSLASGPAQAHLRGCRGTARRRGDDRPAALSAMSEVLPQA